MALPTISGRKRTDSTSGPKPFKPTNKQRQDVRLYKASGLTEPAIAEAIGICQNTLRKYFANELDVARGVERARNLKRLEAAANKGNVTAMKALHVIFDKGEAADLLNDPDYDATRQAQREEKVRGRVSKKDLELQDALQAGENSEWGDDLAPLQNTKLN